MPKSDDVKVKRMDTRTGSVPVLFTLAKRSKIPGVKLLSCAIEYSVDSGHA